MTEPSSRAAVLGGGAAAGYRAVARVMQRPQRSRFDLAVAVLGLLALLAWEIAGLDLALSRQYGTPVGFPWRDAWLTRALLHDGGRALAWCVMAFMVGRALWPADDQPVRPQRWYWIGVSLLCLLLVPTIKRLTASSCPWDLAEFGGAAAYVPHWRLGVSDGGAGHCFPSGHAVAAFGFLSLYFDWRGQHPPLARLWLAWVCLAGTLYGWAQLARGAHYLSHTLWSAWLCWSVCALAAWWRSRRTGARPPLSA
ncbi:MAG TPA: phosphatase PAP2 family protein [Burkholderiaceae bacterium]